MQQAPGRRTIRVLRTPAFARHVCHVRGANGVTGGGAQRNPIRTKLSDGIFQKVWLIQELETIRMCSSGVNSRRFGQSFSLAVKHVLEFGRVVDRGDHLTDPISQAFRRTPEASLAVAGPREAFLKSPNRASCRVYLQLTVIKAAHPSRLFFATFPECREVISDQILRCRETISLFFALLANTSCVEVSTHFRSRRPPPRYEMSAGHATGQAPSILFTPVS